MTEKSDTEIQRKPKGSVKTTPGVILDVAERLFALKGIEGVSLRQIGAAAGSSNHFAVQYHFGSKAELVRAIFERRLPDLERRRARLLMDVKRAGLLEDPRALMGVLLRPLIDQTDAEGHYSYASFLRNIVREGADDLHRAGQDLAPL